MNLTITVADEVPQASTDAGTGRVTSVNATSCMTAEMKFVGTNCQRRPVLEHMT